MNEDYTAAGRRSRNCEACSDRGAPGVECGDLCLEEFESIVRAEEALEVLAIGKRLFICRGERPASYLNRDMTGMTDAGYGPATK